MSVIAAFRTAPGTYPLGKFLIEYPDVSVEVERIVPTGRSVHLAWLTGPRVDPFVQALQEDPTLRHVDVVDERSKRTLVRFEWNSDRSAVFQAIEQAGGAGLALNSTEDGWLIQARFPDEKRANAFHESSRGLGLTLELVRTRDALQETTPEGCGLTELQAETLAAAHAAGYFEVPRQATLAHLADELNVSESAVSERLRRALSTLLISTELDG